MSPVAGRQRKFQRDIQSHRALYRKKNLFFVRNNWVVYWMFLASLEDKGYQPRTVERYHYQLRTFLMWLEGKSFRRVTRQDVERFLLWFKQERQRVAYTIRYLRQSLATFFTFLMSRAALRRNPAMGLRIRTHFPQPEQMEVFSAEEIPMIAKRPREERERLRREDFPTDYSYRKTMYTVTMHFLMLKLLLSTGVRPCEIANVEVADLDEAQGRLRIGNKGHQQYLVEDRHVFVEASTVRELKELLEMSRPVRGPHSGDRLFITYRGGRPIVPHYLDRVVKYWAGRCGIVRPVYAYMCRYTYCTRLVENGVDPYSLKKLMGHKQMATSLIHYLKLTSAELRREWKQFNPLAKRGEG
jgi:integrase/recombinase XerC/integrase/recombinase XerD